MTEQPFKPVQAPAGNGGAPATSAAIKAAVEFVLKAKANEIGSWCARARAAKALEVTLAHVSAGPRRAQWVLVLQALITARGQAVLAALRALAGAAGLDAAVATGLMEIQKVRHGLTMADVTGPGDTPPTLPPGTVTYIEGFVYNTPFYRAVVKALADLQAEIASYAQRPTVLEPLILDIHQELDADAALLSTTVQAADAALQQVGTLNLGPFLTLLTGPLVLCRKNAADVLLLVTPDQVITDVGTGLVTNCTYTLEQQKQLIATARSSAATTCSTAQSSLRSCVLQLDPGFLQALAPLGQVAAGSQQACLTLLNTYQKPWLLCLAALAPAQITLLLDRCCRQVVQQQLTKRVKPTEAGLLSMAVQVLVDDTVDWDVACGRLGKLAYQDVALPPGVQATGWTAVGQCWLPNGFSTASLETDPLCLKHTVEDLGADPTPAKAAAYFADLVTACQTACAGWRSAGKPATYVAPPIALNGASWNIRVKNYLGQPQVFHVDSGYQKSPWVKRVV
ncbi:hypothetical protein GCM10009760_36130 [Kitasatospora kazusensis]|uniref:Uncharacterized protein n=1 Tax=Kitasatospora kazusensis TaxID=407974 RepID=A0ABP5LFN7_9ACTN